MPKDRVIALGAFLAGVGLVVGYAVWAVFLSTPAVAEEGGSEAPAAIEAPADLPRLEIAIAGEGANGTVVLELFEHVAPQHVERILTLARDGQYDGVVFHRVIEGFMAQTGDVQYGKMGADMRYAGMGGSDLPDLPAEFSGESFDVGVVGMARSQNPNSANSQFFIMFAPASHLDGAYTIVGRVVEGMEVVNAIKRGTGQNGAVTGQPDVMQSVRVVE